jgi:putative inorganic carbon (HCO3(-)) transporter
MITNDKTVNSIPMQKSSLLDINKASLMSVVIASVLGILISIAVGQFGWLTLVTIPALAMVFSTVSNPSLGLMALIIVIFAQVQRAFTEFLGLPGPGQPLVGFLIMVIVIRMLLFNERSVNWLRNSFILVVYVVFLMVSVVAAQNMEPAITELIDLAQNILISSLAIYIIKESSSLRNAIWAVIFAGILMASISVYQNLTGTFSNEYWGFGGNEFSGYVGRPRITGPYLTPNPYAQVLAIIFIVALDRTWHESKIILRLVAGAGALLCALALIFTDSRGGFANLIFTIFVYFLFNRPNFSAMLVISVFSLVVIQFLPGNFAERILTLTELNPFKEDTAVVADESFRGRTSENIAAMMMFSDYPIFGVGLSNYGENYQKYSREIGLDPRREEREPASLYLQLLAEQGVIGTSVFLLLVVSIFMKLLKAQRDFKLLGMRDEMYITSALFASLAGYMFMSIYKNNAYTNVFWMLIAICISAAQIATNIMKPDEESGNSMEFSN